MSRVYILLLNWNNWEDTLECLESLLRLDYPDYRLVVCDNGSSDQSVEHLVAWARGFLDVLPEKRILSPTPAPAAKPLSVAVYDRIAAEQGGEVDAQLVIIRNGANLGFAAGNNVGLRYVLARGDADFIWVLNNDTMADPAALRTLVARMAQRPDAGICGSTILNYWRPGQIDGLGGALYFRWLGLAWHLGRGRAWPRYCNTEAIQRRMDYVIGASMFVTPRFLREIGLMEEGYFLFYEELDWAVRCRGRFALAYAPESIVYHKVGGTIGTASHPVRKSRLADFYTLRNRLRFTRRYCPWALPTVYLGVLVAVIVRLLFGEWRKAVTAWRLLSRPHLSFEECAGDQ